MEYVYEQPLVMPNGTRRLPDFTISPPGRPPVYWEHLGMLNKPGHHADWESKKQWYSDHGIAPWTEGGGPNGTLVWSTEGHLSTGIDSTEIEQLVRDVLA